MSRRFAAHTLLVGVFVGCGDDGGSRHGPPPSAVAGDPFGEPMVISTVAPNGERVEVAAIDNTFRADTVEVEAGTAVQWVNQGRNDHDIKPVVGAEWGVEAERFAPDDVYETVFTRRGTYDYYCTLHGTATAGMVGTIVVTD